MTLLSNTEQLLASPVPLPLGACSMLAIFLEMLPCSVIKEERWHVCICWFKDNTPEALSIVSIVLMIVVSLGGMGVAKGRLHPVSSVSGFTETTESLVLNSSGEMSPLRCNIFISSL